MILFGRGLSPHPTPRADPPRPRRSIRADAAPSGRINGTNGTNGANGPPPSTPVKSDLRIVPGVGKRNKELLMQQQVQNVQALTLEFEQRGRNKESMLEWLAKDVGIRRHHGNAIVNYLAHELRGAGQQGGARCHVTLAVEGNISAGKSTLLRMLVDERMSTRSKQLAALRNNLEVVFEPVERWQNIGNESGKAINILDLFYSSPERYAYTFQNFVFLTRMVQEHESRSTQKPVRMLERSVFSDRHVFVRAVHENAWLSEAELQIYDSWFHPFIDTHPDLVPDGFIYMRADPETCLRRMHHRSRTEELSVPLDYLESLHMKHDEWLLNGSLSVAQINNPGQGSQEEDRCEGGNGGLLLVKPEPEAIKGQVRFLRCQNNPALQKHLNNVPVLVVDCNPDIDVENDVQAREYFARQVNEYWDYVHQYKQTQAGFRGSATPNTPLQLLLKQRGRDGGVNLPSLLSVQ